MTTAVAERPKASQGVMARLRIAFYSSEAFRGYTLLSPTLFVVVFMLAAPVVLTIAYSFWTQQYITIFHDFTLHNYQSALGEKSHIFWTLLGRSLAISGLVTFFTLVLAYPMAYYVAFQVEKNKLFWIIMMSLPFLTSYLLRVFAWKVILGYEGVINGSLIALGIVDEPVDWLLYNPNAVVITLTHAWAAFAILPIYVSLEKIDKSLLEAATDLGDGPVARFLRVTFPLSLPGVIAASLMIFIPTVADYVTPTLVGGPDGTMIANWIQAQFGRASNWPFGSALSILTMIVITICALSYLFLTRLYTKRIA